MDVTRLFLIRSRVYLQLLNRINNDALRHDSQVKRIYNVRKKNIYSLDSKILHDGSCMPIISFELLMNLRYRGGSGIKNAEGFGRFFRRKEEPEENFRFEQKINFNLLPACRESLSLFRTLFIYWKDGDLWSIFAASWPQIKSVVDWIDLRVIGTIRGNSCSVFFLLKFILIVRRHKVWFHWFLLHWYYNLLPSFCTCVYYTSHV